MYLNFYGLSKKPFNLMPDPDFLHFSDKHLLAYNLLEYGIYEQTGITVITGEIGSGKTTLIRHLLNKINYRQMVVGLIDNTHEAWGDLATWIASAFNLDYANQDKATMYKNIKQFFIQQYAQRKRVLLIVDEAQNMSEQTLEELRLLTNINSGKDYLLQIILVGQPELQDTLMKPNLTQLAQRVSVEYHLDTLDMEETKSYIEHRLKTAGCESMIFDRIALEQIYRASNGTPRLINTICDQALVYGYAQNRREIGGDIILDITKNRKINSANKFSRSA